MSYLKELENLVFSANFKIKELNEQIKFEIETNKIRSKIYDASKEEYFNENMRKCGISWIPLNKNLLTEKVLTQIVHRVNKEKEWNLKLSGWQCDIQYTYYYEKQDHYDWHVDVLKDDDSGQQRLITVVYCLTPANNYTGANLEFKYKNQIISIKLDVGDFVVFQSHLLHRVTKLTGGKRETLVGWYK